MLQNTVINQTTIKVKYIQKIPVEQGSKMNNQHGGYHNSNNWQQLQWQQQLKKEFCTVLRNTGFKQCEIETSFSLSKDQTEK